MPRRRLRIRDLLNGVPTTSNLIQYAGTCSLGFVAGSRDTANAAISEQAEAHADKRAVAAAARAELASLKGQSEAVLKRRRELTAILAAPERGRERRPLSKQDSQAAALGFYIRAAGWQVTDDAVGTWLNLGTVMFLELAAAMSLTVVAALRPTPPAASPAPAPLAPADAPPKPVEAATDKKGRGSDENDGDPPASPPKAPRRPGRPATVLPAQAVERLREAGGKANGTVRGVGRLLGTRSKTAAHRLLHQLAGAGLVRMTATPHGVTVALA